MEMSIYNHIQAHSLVFRILHDFPNIIINFRKLKFLSLTNILLWVQQRLESAFGLIFFFQKALMKPFILVLICVPLSGELGFLSLSFRKIKNVLFQKCTSFSVFRSFLLQSIGLITNYVFELPTYTYFVIWKLEKTLSGCALLRFLL